MEQWPHERTRSLVLEMLKQHPKAQFQTLLVAVFDHAIALGIIPDPKMPGRMTVYSPGGNLPPADRKTIEDDVREILWELLVQGLLVFGSDANNPNWPFYRLTKRGEQVVREVHPQPYDPDGFLRAFDVANPRCDAVVREYLVEALQAFNSRCHKAAAVMLGCASERLILRLSEVLATVQLPDGERKRRATRTRSSINEVFADLRLQLSEMLDAKTVSRSVHSDTILRHLPGMFDIIRMHRNAAGHPDVMGHVTHDALFIDLRIFADYVRRTEALMRDLEALFLSDSTRDAPTPEAD